MRARSASAHLVELVATGLALGRVSIRQLHTSQQHCRVPQKMRGLLLLALVLAAALAIPVDPVMSYVDEERMNVGPQTNMAEQVRGCSAGGSPHFMVPGLASESVPASEELMPAGQTIERLPSLERREPMPRAASPCAPRTACRPTPRRPPTRRAPSGARRGARSARAADLFTMGPRRPRGRI